MLKLVDLAEAARKARARGLLLVVDNTFASPYGWNVTAKTLSRRHPGWNGTPGSSESFIRDSPATPSMSLRQGKCQASGV